MAETNNSKTLAAYERNIGKFIERTPKNTIGETKIWLDSLIKKVTPDSNIFEVGSGFGRDAEYMTARGLTIHCSDGAAGFVNVLRQKGLDAQQFNAFTDDFTDKYDLIFADAVFEHFTAAQLSVVLKKIFDATVTGGSLGFSVRRGDGEYWSTEKLGEKRYFCLWQPNELSELLSKVGYSVESVAESTGYQDIERLYFIANK
jgi:SAM-dependent methyltransferase